MGPVLETTLGMARAPRVDSGDFFGPFVEREAEVVNALAREERDKAEPGETEEFGGFAAGDAAFLIQPQDDELFGSLGGLGRSAEEGQEVSGERDLQRGGVSHGWPSFRRGL